MSEYINVVDLNVYQLSRRLSSLGWDIYQSLSWEHKKIMGDQFIRSTDSVGANLVEGYHRYHYKDKVKFYYYSRASLAECQTHWLNLLFEREVVSEEKHREFEQLGKVLEVKLNNFIAVTKKQLVP
ncbi:four helix bundle protein [Marinilabiliaceae bacterium JC017]|nr:four helix bundle protein [Marinilabiliaceae bacterium JC017]